MPVKIHEHNDDCKWGGGFLHFLVEAAPDVLWYDVQDVGSYQGSVYGVGEYKKKILIYEDGYGSCSGCGAWGEGGEPTNQEEVLSRSKLFSNSIEAKKYIEEMDRYDTPDIGTMKNAIDEVSNNL